MKFGQDMGPQTIGIRRDQEIERTAGPGYYEHERADSLTKIQSRRIDFNQSPERPELVVQNANLPVSYGGPHTFEAKLGAQTIGVRREENIETSVGPG